MGLRLQARHRRAIPPPALHDSCLHGPSHCTTTRVGGNKKAHSMRLPETTMQTLVPSRSGLLVLALVSSSSVAIGQEVTGQAQAMGAPLPKAISVSQQQLDAADKDSANFLHSN